MGVINNLEGDLACGSPFWKIYSCRLGWNSLSPRFPKHSLSNTHTHTTERERERETERMSEKATFYCQACKFFLTSSGKKWLGVTFEHHHAHAEHMEYFPFNLINFFFKSGCTLKGSVVMCHQECVQRKGRGKYPRRLPASPDTCLFPLSCTHPMQKLIIHTYIS